MKKVFIFLLGAIAGGAGGYYLTKKHYEKVIDIRVTEELSKANNLNEEEVIEEYEEAEDDYDPNDLNEEDMNDPELQKKIEKAHRELNTRRRTYNKIVKSESYISEDAPEEFWDPEAEFIDKPENPQPPYIITEDQHWEDDRTYDAEMLTWNEEEGELIDHNGDPIDDIDSTVGLDNLLKHFDGDVIYIRNESELVDYEITRVEALDR